MQLKMNHDYFKSYLVRLPGYSTDRCLVCGTRKDLEHLILHCKVTHAVREKLRDIILIAANYYYYYSSSN